MAKGKIRYKIVLLVALLLIALTACGGGDGYKAYDGKPIASADIQGRWVSNCGATMEIKADGVAVVSNYPRGGDRNDRYSGEAMWSLDLGSGWRSNTDPPQLEIAVNNYSDMLSLASAKGGLGFALQMGDPDKGGYCVFSRS